MGFLKFAIDIALNNQNVSSQQQAIRYIIDHPLNDKEELKAKIKELTNSGYKEDEALLALNKYAQNVSHSLKYLNHGKPKFLDHYLYHINSSSIINAIHNENNDEKLDDFYLQINDKIHYEDKERWNYYENYNYIVNFECNKLLTIKKLNNNTYIPVLRSNAYSLLSQTSNVDTSEFKWNINTQNRYIQHLKSKLYLSYSNEKSLYFEKSYSDKNSLWLFMSESDIRNNKHVLITEEIERENECIICYENTPNIRLSPCNHKNFCSDCIEELNPTSCPVCRTSIKGRFRI